MNTTQTETDRHNAYGWIKPTADACEICGKKEYATPVNGFQVKPCGCRERLICEDHADTDADCDQYGYFATSWTCKDTSQCQQIADDLASKDMSLERVEWAIKEAYKTAKTKQDELWYFDGLLTVIFVRRDAVVDEAALEQAMRDTAHLQPIEMERR